MEEKAPRNYRWNPNEREQFQLVAVDFLIVCYVNSFPVLGNGIRSRRSWNRRTIAECGPGIIEERNEP
jgi:hypothetical protein